VFHTVAKFVSKIVEQRRVYVPYFGLLNVSRQIPNHFLALSFQLLVPANTRCEKCQRYNINSKLNILPS
jgi:hypothetical protein